MFNFNPDLMQLDDSATGAPRVAGPRNEPVSPEELARIMDEENAKYNPTTGIPLSEPEGQVPAGFTPGPFPQELEKFFGSSKGTLGYRIETLTDKVRRIYDSTLVQFYNYRIDRFEKKLNNTKRRRNKKFEKRILDHSIAVWSRLEQKRKIWKSYKIEND